ncbi:hypothetical protein B296_00036573 [Ensete ventricosum]|uniref:Uncharacterized protein n=1 Tax=Ensete ventricosum TaxID=4639 RepID=A0A427A211_ENSVE|nr:hypothetical protein B296_00036573 [Ensete ventricosum]
MEMSGSQPSQFITSNGSRGISRGSGAPLIDDIEMGQIIVPERSGFYLSLFFAVIGTAFALNMLFKIPVWCGVLLTGLSTLLLLLLQQYGVIFLFHSSFDNLLAFLINVSVISLSFLRRTRDTSSFNVLLFQNVLGNWSSKLFAIALLASGQSSTITGTYAGQYVMQVFALLAFLLLKIIAALSFSLVFTNRK